MKSPGIVAFAFGTPYTLSSNCILAEIASNKMREVNGLIFTQRDIQVEAGIPVTYATEQEGKTSPTLRMSREAVRWAQKNQMTELWVVAAQPHLSRVLRDMERARQEIGVNFLIQPCPEIDAFDPQSWFCPDSTQTRVRTLRLWNQRENILLRTPFWLYRLVAN